MVDLVETHGGDVLKFAGDALMVAWPLPLAPDSGADAQAAAAALACSLAMLRVEPTAPSPTEKPLTLHCALHTGTLAELHVGVEGSWVHLLSGEACLELGPLISAAGPEELCTSAAFWQLLLPADAEAACGMPCAEGIRVSPLRARVPPCTWSNSPLKQPSAAARAAIEAYLPRAISDALREGSQAWLAENRRVSVLFLSLPLLGAADFQLAQAFAAEVHAAVQRAGGAVQQWITDDKGTVCIAVWGRPPLTHTDDPSRALACACALVGSLQRIAAACGRTEALAGGVTTGRAFVGNVGSPSRCEHNVVGEVMNSAARLMDAARSARVPLYCDAATARAEASAVTEAGGAAPGWFQNGPAFLALKGHTQPMAVFAPLPPRRDARASSTSSEGTFQAPPRISSASMGGSVRNSPRVSNANGSAYPFSISTVRRSSMVESLAESYPSSSSFGVDADEELERTASDTGAPAPPFSPTPMCGRQAELERITGLLSDAHARPGLLVSVVGGMSMGKTTVLRAVAEAAHTSLGLDVLPLMPPSGVVAIEPPFSAWHTDWFAAEVCLRAPSLTERLRPLAPLLADLLPPGEIDIQELMRSLGGGADGAVAATMGTLSEEERMEGRMLLALFVLRPCLTSGSALLLCDDLHAADEQSRELLARVLAELRPAVLVAAGREELDDPASDGSAALALLTAAALTARTVRIGVLDAAAVAVLACSELRVPSQALPATLAASLLDLTGGHPLFVKEVLALLLRQGHLTVLSAPGGGSRVTQPHGDVARLPELADLGAFGDSGSSPQSDELLRMELLVQRRVDSLGAAARGALKAAAVLARSFDLPLLARTCGGGMTLAAARACASELVDEGMFVSHSSQERSAASFSFAHELVRRLVYTATPADARIELHGRVLAWLEGQEAPAAGRCAQELAELARHARGAHAHAKATTYFLACARASARVRAMDVSRFAQEGLASLRLATAAEAARPRSSRRHSRGSSARSSTARVSAISAHGGARVSTMGVRIGSRLNLETLAGGERGRSSASSSNGHPDVTLSPLEILRAELDDVLATVKRVQASWASIEPCMAAWGPSLMRHFFNICPDAFKLFSFGGMTLADADIELLLRKHSLTVLATIGGCVAGVRDIQTMIPTLTSVGKMHARFGPNMRVFFPHMGSALLLMLHEALGESFTEDVEQAWSEMYALVSFHIVEGIALAEKAQADESQLRATLTRHVLAGISGI